MTTDFLDSSNPKSPWLNLSARAASFLSTATGRAGGWLRYTLSGGAVWLTNLSGIGRVPLGGCLVPQGAQGGVFFGSYRCAGRCLHVSGQGGDGGDLGCIMGDKRRPLASIG